MRINTNFNDIWVDFDLMQIGYTKDDGTEASYKLKYESKHVYPTWRFYDKDAWMSLQKPLQEIVQKAFIDWLAEQYLLGDRDELFENNVYRQP